MISELGKLFIRDAIKFNFLRDIIDGKIKISFALNNSQSENYAASIRSPESRVKVYGSFNISEDPEGKILTVRAVAINAKLKISLEIPEDLSSATKNVSLYKSADKSVENVFELSNLIDKIEITPYDSQSYSVIIESRPADPSKLQNELNEIKSRVELGDNLIKYYDEDKSREVQNLLNEIKPKLLQAEEKLRDLITARENDTKRIEISLKG